MKEQQPILNKAIGTSEPAYRPISTTTVPKEQRSQEQEGQMSRIEAECSPLSLPCTVQNQKEHLVNDHPDRKIIVIG